MKGLKAFFTEDKNSSCTAETGSQVAVQVSFEAVSEGVRLSMGIVGQEGSGLRTALWDKTKVGSCAWHMHPVSAVPKHVPVIWKKL